MDKSAKFALGFVDTWQKLTRRFMALPTVLKILLSPFILVFSFTIFLPIIAIAAISYKGLKTIGDTFVSMYKLRKSLIRIMRLVSLFTVLTIICFSLLMLVVILLFQRLY